MEEQTPHTLHLEAAGMPRDEALNLLAKQFPLVRKGQHVWFEVPAFGGCLDPVYAFARSKGLTILDVAELNCMPPRWRVKCVDTP